MGIQPRGPKITFFNKAFLFLHLFIPIMRIWPKVLAERFRRSKQELIERTSNHICTCAMHIWQNCKIPIPNSQAETQMRQSREGRLFAATHVEVYRLMEIHHVTSDKKREPGRKNSRVFSRSQGKRNADSTHLIINQTSHAGLMRPNCGPGVQ